MSTHGRERACMDRCEVCQRVIVARPDPKRRRCADHLGQLVLVPDAAVRPSSTTRKAKGARSGRGTDDTQGKGSR